jgi:hypothetical protein
MILAKSISSGAQYVILLHNYSWMTKSQKYARLAQENGFGST